MNSKIPKMMFIILMLSFPVIQPGCKKSEAPAPASIEAPAGKFESETLIRGSNVRKNGFLSIEAGEIGNIKKSIKALAGEYNAQILEESVSVGSDDSLRVYYRIKIKSENFSIFIDKISALGKLIDLNIQAEDVSDEAVQQSDRIDLLTSRLNDAKKSNDSRLVDSLQNELNEAKKTRTEIKTSVLFSYINLTIVESSKLSHAFSLGYYYGKEGFIWTVKIVIIALIAGVPLIFLLVVVKLLLALTRYRWNRLKQYFERLGRGKS